MGFKTPDFPPVDPETFLGRPLMERTKALALHWVEFGFGTPKMVHTIYLVKMTLLWFAAGALIVSWTSGVGPVWQLASWWNEPIVYQKAVVWTLLLETIGIAGSWGPLAGKFKPMTGGIRYWARAGTIRLRPWRAVPGTNGDTRTPLDVLLYLGFLGVLATIMILPGSALPDRTAGLVSPTLCLVAVGLLVLCGLRDKTIFLAARGEQYGPALVFFGTLGFVDMIVAAKLLIVTVWVGAGVSKLGRHFSNVVPPMLSNSPSMPLRAFKRALYRDFPHDLRPSKVASLIAHGGGTFVEIVTPLVLLFSTNRTLTLLGVALMVAPCTARAVDCSPCCSSTSRTSTGGRSGRPSSPATPCSASTSATATCTTRTCSRPSRSGAASRPANFSWCGSSPSRSTSAPRRTR